MSFFEEDNYWNEEPIRKIKKENIEEPKLINGRFILHKYKCPLCGRIEGCGVKKGNKDGFPVLYCETNNKWVECVYKYF